MAEETKQEYDSVPRTQEDLAERLANGNRSDRVLSTSDQGEELQRRAREEGGRDFRVEDNDTSGYVGALSPEYVTYANETEKPLQAESGPEADLEDQIAEFREGLNLPGVAGVEESAYADKEEAAEQATADAKDKVGADADAKAPKSQQVDTGPQNTQSNT